jgi:Yip1 domain
MSQFVNRMMRAAKLDAQVYEEVEADKSAMTQAMTVVVLSSVAGGIGFMQETGFTGLVFGAVLSLAGWYIWAMVTYLIGTKLLPEPQTSADVGELLRTIGFSSAPGLIRVFAIIPALDLWVTLVATVWMLVAMVVAVRQALDYHSTYRAVGVCVLGWIVQALIILVIVWMIGGLPEPMPAH